MEVSVIIPVFNAAKFVERAVKSALLQEEVKEVLVVDDGSTDDSRIIVQKLILTDSRVRLFQHPGETNRGPGASRNLGLEKARMDYIAFLDADDVFVENRFGKTKAVFQGRPDTDGVYECLKNIFSTEEVRARFMAQSKVLEYMSVKTEELPPEHLFERLVLDPEELISICALTLKMDFIKSNGLQFEESIRMAEEVGLIFECALKGKLRGGQLQAPVVRRYVHGENSIFNTDLLYESYMVFYRKWFLRALRGAHSGAVVWFFFLNHLHHNRYIQPFLKWSPLRYSMKSLLLLFYFFRYPKLALRLLRPRKLH